MEDSPWTAIVPAEWAAVAHLQGRLATAEDVRAGRAVFVLEGQAGQAAPVPLELPRCGLQTLEDGTVRPVVVIQAEQMAGRTILGVRYLPGGGGVCELEEVRLLDGPAGWLPTRPEKSGA